MPDLILYRVKSESSPKFFPQGRNMDTDGIAEGIDTSVPDVFHNFLRRNDSIWMKEKIFQKATFFPGKNKRGATYRSLTSSCIEGNGIPLQAHIILNKFSSGETADSSLQFFKVKRLSKVIIGAKIQSLYFILDLSSG